MEQQFSRLLTRVIESVADDGDSRPQRVICVQAELMGRPVRGVNSTRLRFPSMPMSR